MKGFVVVGIVVGSVLSIYVGSRLTDQTLAMLVGFFFGILAGIPSSLMLLAMNRRQPQPKETNPQPQAPVIMLGGYGQTVDPAPPTYPEPPLVQRRITSKQEVKRVEW